MWYSPIIGKTMAEDALSLVLSQYETEDKTIPIPSDCHILKQMNDPLYHSSNVIH